MITLVTGTPGSGKSAYSLTLMLTLLAQKRPLFVHGVTGLTLPHTLVRCSSKACMVCPDLPDDTGIPNADDWLDWAPNGAVMWWDEVQHVHRPRTSGSKVPPSVAGYETHRHRGLDFFMVTQHPKLIDSNVRQLVGRHVHLVSSWKGRSMFEWPECSDSLSNKADAVKSSYALPKHVFPLYQSSQLHTKPLRKLPPIVYAFAACVVLLAFLGYRVYDRIDQITHPEQQTQQANEIQKKDSPPVGLIQTSADSSGTGQFKPAAFTDQFDYTPKIANVPESAPAFAALAKPTDFPKLSGCIVDRKEPEGCRCYTQQATPYFVSPDQCRAYVKYGRFNPYRAGGGGREAPTNNGPQNQPLSIAKNP